MCAHYTDIVDIYQLWFSFSVKTDMVWNFISGSTKRATMHTNLRIWTLESIVSFDF